MSPTDPSVAPPADGDDVSAERAPDTAERAEPESPRRDQPDDAEPAADRGARHLTGPADGTRPPRVVPPTARSSEEPPVLDALAASAGALLAGRASRTAEEPPVVDALAVSAGARLAELPGRTAEEPPVVDALAVSAGARLAERSPRTPKAPSRGTRARKVKARKVRRVVRHVEPVSVLKISLLFFFCVFLILCVASAVLWNAARSAGAVDDVESFITSLGYGNCEDAEGAEASDSTTTTTVATDTAPADQINPVPAPDVAGDETPNDSSLPDEDGNCPEGKVLVGGFEFEDGRIFQAFALGGIVLVLAGAAGAVVLALLFNLISDVTGGMRFTVLEEEPPRRRRPAGSGSPGSDRRD